MNNAANCLNLVGDGDDIEVLHSIEEAFGVKISDEEAFGCETVGQLFDVVSSKLNISKARNLRCPTAIAFFRLRAALRRLGYVHRMTTKTDLRAIFRAHGVRRLHSSLSSEAGLQLPLLQLHPASTAILAFVAACGAFVPLWVGSWLPVLAAAVLAIILGFVLPRTIPRRIANLGDFAVDCVAWNYGSLSAQAGGARRGDAWKALTTVVREIAGFEGKVNYDTRFFAEQS